MNHRTREYRQRFHRELIEQRPAPVEDRMMRERHRIRCRTCAGAGEVFEVDASGVEQVAPCRKCDGTGCAVILLCALLWLMALPAPAATVTGYIRNRQGAYVSTNINFLALQRPLFDNTPSVMPGWTLTTNSAANGFFSTPLLAGNYRVTVGQQIADSFIIAVPGGDASYDVSQIVTNGLFYTYTNTPASTVYGGTNVTTTNLTSRFGLFKQLASGIFEWFGIEQGTNVVLYHNNSNIVINAVAASGGGSGNGLALEGGSSGNLALED